jgi:hypothetical protein
MAKRPMRLLAAFSIAALNSIKVWQRLAIMFQGVTARPQPAAMTAQPPCARRYSR